MFGFSGESLPFELLSRLYHSNDFCVLHLANNNSQHSKHIHKFDENLCSFFNAVEKDHLSLLMVSLSSKKNEIGVH